MANSLLLAIDNSLDFLNCALAVDGRLVEERHAASLAHSSQVLPGRVRGLLIDNGYTLDDVTLIAVTLGPGSFTGIRVALAFAKGLAAGLAVPVVGVPTLDALAAPFSFVRDRFICPLIDAKKGEVFFSCYRSEEGELIRSSGYRSLRPESLVEVLPRPALCFGSGLSLCGPALAGLDGVAVISDGYRRITGEHLVARGRQLYAAGQGFDLKPIYGRKSEAEIRFRVDLS